jgi:L-seryl-tRNA(Ser) seleniumtransferase
VSAETCASQIGSGALPVERLASVSLAVRPADAKGEGRFLASLERAFRALPVPVIGRVGEGAFRLDLRCLEPAQEAAFVAQLDSLALKGRRA